MEYRKILKIFLLNEQGALKRIGKEATVILGDLEGLEKGLGQSGKYLRSVIKNLDNLDPAEFAKLEKRGVNIGELVSKAEKATAQNADSIAKEIDDAIKGNVSTAAGKITSTKASGKKQYFDDPESQKLLDRIEGLRASGATDEEVKPFRDQLLRLQGADPQVVDDISKKLQKLQSDYDTAVKTGGEDSPRAIKIKKEMEELNGVTNFTRIKRFCGKEWKRGGLCLAVLGTAGFAAYKAVNSLIDPDSESAKPSGIEGGVTKSSGYAWRSCPDTLLKVGCRGENVRRMQQKLVDCGFSLPKYGVDGKFKYETKAAVVKFQSDNSLKAYGIVGAETSAALQRCGLSPNVKKSEPKVKTYQPQQADTSLTKDIMNQQNDLPALKQMQDYYVTPSGGTVEIPNFKQGEDDTLDGIPKKAGKEVRESRSNNTSKLISKRNEMLEKLVFERLVKNANRL